jgi:Fe-S cluster assembly iron-binding protein IscA
MIEITDLTKDKIKEVLDDNPGKYFRLVLEGDGCAGPYLGMVLDEAEPNEVTTTVNGVEILLSEQVKRYAEVTTINILLNHIAKD